MTPFNILDYDWYHPKIRFVRLERSRIDVLGPFEREIHKLVEVAAQKSGKNLPEDAASIIMPVHELQIQNIIAKFPDVDILDDNISVQALAQASIRYALSLSNVQHLKGFQDCCGTRASWDGSQAFGWRQDLVRTQDYFTLHSQFWTPVF